MKQLSVILVAGLSFLMLACSSVTVKHDFDPEYDFLKFKTYRWASAKEINPQDELQKYPLVYKRVVASVDKALAKKGMKKVEGDDFDVVVVAHAGSKERMQVTQTGGGYYGGYGGWYDPWWGPYGGSTTVSYFEEATLVVDIVSWEKKELAWRGMATGVVKDLEGEEQQQRLDGIAEKIFAEYPPGQKGK
jgi:hypothetical protein